MKAVILGCGPAGLLAAHACAMHDMDVTIYSKRVPSFITGAMFVHEPIPPFNDPLYPDGQVIFAKEGTERGYAMKVYGNPNEPTSWRNYDEGTIPGWSMLELYEKLWDKYQVKIVNCDLSKPPLLMRIAQQPFDVKISTIPAPILCQNPREHVFRLRSIWVKSGEPMSAIYGIPDNTVIYNGNPAIPWHRASNLFGDVSFEFAKPTNGAKHIRKPLSTNCDCRPQWERAGRYGKWERGVLAHTAFFESYALHEL